MISRFALDPESLACFPTDLLDGSRESVRMAERILQEIGVEAGRAPLAVLSERLAVRDPGGRDDMPLGPYVGVRPRISEEGAG